MDQSSWCVKCSLLVCGRGKGFLLEKAPFILLPDVPETRHGSIGCHNSFKPASEASCDWKHNYFDSIKHFHLKYLCILIENTLLKLL